MKNSPAPPTAPAGAKPAAGETSIPFVPGQRILVDARINGSANAKLLLDTGADKTLVSPRALQAAGVRIAGPTTTAEVAGATGSAQMQFVFVDSIEVGEARVGRMAVGSQNLPIEEADGVLGRDFLDQFNVNIDSSKGVVTLSPK
jgi:predicted aspartyl protease